MIRRLATITSVSALATSVAVAQPKPDPNTAPPAAPPATPEAPPPPAEEPPPKDIEGRDENPGNPGGTGEDPTKQIVVPVKKKEVGYPIQEYARPINLPANMSEVALGPHAQLGLGDGEKYAGGDALRARYGVTREVQIGLTYLFAGVYDDPATPTDDKLGFHGGKAVGLDVTVLLQDWIGIRVGVPVYLKPVALSLAIGVPMKFQLGDKFAVGGLDDLLNIKLKRFAPNFYQEAINATNAFLDESMTQLSDGQLRISAFGIYQKDPKTAFVGRLGFQMEDFTATSTGSMEGGGLTYFLRAGVQYSPRRRIDLGVSVGFDDLADAVGSFGPAALLAVRI